MVWGPIIGAIGGLGSAAIGAMSGGGGGGGSAAADRAAERFYDFDDPNYDLMRWNLEELKQLGILTPEMEQAILQGETSLNNVSIDPRLQKAEMDALETLSRISGEGGMDAQAMLGMRQAQMAAQNQARGAREANLMNAAQRGVAGSGLEFVSNQMADQDAANQAEMAGLTMAASANARDLDALNRMSDIGSNLTNRQLGLDVSRASAQDAIDRFNTTIRGDVNSRNVGARNTAAERNLNEAQRIGDSNVAIRNTQQQYNKGLEQQKFDNSLARATGAAGVAPTQVNAANNAAQATNNLWGGIGKTMVGAGTAIGDYYAGNKKKKEEDV